MTAKFEVDGDTTTIIFEWTAPTNTIQSIIGDMAHKLWDSGLGNHGSEEDPIDFDELSNQVKLNLVEKHLKQILVNMSNSHKSKKAQQEAREREELTEYKL